MKIIEFIKLNKFLLIIIILAAVIRLWDLGNVPPSLTPDEASLGYNAYSILKTGRDEYGKLFPIIFKSFGDYKPGLYVYLTIPSVAILGLTEFAVRLPSALSGVLIVYLLYLITAKLFKSLKIGNWSLEIVVALVATFNPWLIYFSRGAWEANFSLMLTLIGIYFFLKSIEASKYIVHSSVFFALTLLTYQGAKLSTLIVVLILTIIYLKDINKIARTFLAKSLLIGIIITSPVVLSLFNGQSSRLEVFSIFSYRRPIEETGKYLNNYYYLYHSEPLNYFRAISGRWFNVFSGSFLFFEGDSQNPIHTAPYQGVMLLSDLLFLPLGFFMLFKNKLEKSHKFILIWLILAPLSATISRDTTNAVRSLNTAVPLIIISSFGLFFIIRKFNKIIVVCSMLYALCSMIYFIDSYFIHLPAHNSQIWRYGYKQAVNYVIDNKENYSIVVFEQSYNQPYIYYLFYSRRLIKTDLSSGENIKDVGLVQFIDGIEFKNLDWQELRNINNVLVVSSQNPLNLKTEKQIKFLNGYDTAFNIIKL